MAFRDDLENRILILDGGMGSLIQRRGLAGGDNELLNITHEDVISGIVQEYIDAGADIVTTNSFGANSISQQIYGKAHEAARLAFSAASLARRVADKAGRKVYVAGSMGPTGKSLSLPSDAADPAARVFDFEAMSRCYEEEAAALVKGGADLILLETSFDALNAKAAICALERLDNPLPLIISATVSDRSGRTITGQRLEAFYRAVEHAPNLCAFGINCALGAVAMGGLVREIASFSSLPLIFYPNAGIPDELGRYNDSPELMAQTMEALAKEGLLNIAGGCCGTTPDHIKAIRDALKGFAPRKPLAPDGKLHVSGLEAYTIDKSLNFTNIGERTNVAGSRKFARLIASGSYDEALEVAAAQIEGGAGIIDINLDDPMLDSTEQMRIFLRHISGDPRVAKAALMIDSSHWETILEGLRCAQGKCIVNSISLKDGQEEFLRKARIIHEMGAAMVVMAFDEKGQAVTRDRKIEICSRSYGLLTEAGIPPQEIIFDCNILSIGTGIPEHARFGIDFIEAVRWIKANLPGAKTSGGVSNLSFAFRGNNAVREAMHSAFLYHAIAAGLDMAIVNPQMLQVYDSIDPELKRCVEDVIFDTDEGATARLIEKASQAVQEQSASSPEEQKGPQDAVGRLQEALFKGGSPSLKEDALECLSLCGSAIKVIDGPLMEGMEKVGALFSEGKMFLPQVVKAAKVMKDAVSALQPFIESGSEGSKRPKFVIATVQGDVHDIGKNITSIVLQCSGFEVVDLGVMVPCDEILDKAEAIGADCIGVSGLITPSLHRMEEICAEMTRRGFELPLFVGGAAASAVHTAVKLAPLYPNVHYGACASDTAVMAGKYLQDPAAFRAADALEQEKLRAIRSAVSSAAKPVAASVPCEGFLEGTPFQNTGLLHFSAAGLEKEFDWNHFTAVCGDSSQKTREEALATIRTIESDILCCAQFYPVRRDGDILDFGGFRLPMLRGENCLADFFPSGGISQAGIFAVRATGEAEGDLVRHAVLVTLAETGCQILQKRFLKMLPEGIKLIMPGIGYSSCPDHSLKRDILAQLPSELNIRLTESCAMIPEASICGLVIAHRDASFRSVGKVDGTYLDNYSALRGFSSEERDLFLSQLQ